MNEDKSLTTRKEDALTKSQHTGGLIDKHLGQLSEQKPRDSEEIHEIEFRSGKYTGHIKDGMPHGKGIAEYSEIISGGPRYDFKIRGEWINGSATGFCIENFYMVRETSEKLDVGYQLTQIGEFRSDELNGHGAYLETSLKTDSLGSEHPQDLMLKLGDFAKGRPRGINASTDWFNRSERRNENWLDADFVGVSVDEGAGQGRSGLDFHKGLVKRTEENNYLTKGESDRILNDLYIDREREVIRWHGPSGTPAEGAWITADLASHFIKVLKQNTNGYTEGVQSRIVSERVLEILCG
ncbi:MAG: hypothetical protein HOB33_10210, partial [Bacteroidetes Order II. Incertae sedis bacterium]|nr:hypothetical protein [Bacteroidetes Order II. bacterium]